MTNRPVFPADSAGQLVATEQTDAFAVVTQASGKDPQSGRFLSRDPVAGSLGVPLSLNRSTYVQDNPVSAVDPPGLVPAGPDALGPTASGRPGKSKVLQGAAPTVRPAPAPISIPWPSCSVA